MKIAAAFILFFYTAFAQQPAEIIWEAEAKSKVVTFSPDGLTMYTGGLENQSPYNYGNIRKWDVQSRTLLNTLTGYHIGNTNDLSVHPSGNFVASGHGDIYCVPPSGACYNVITGFFIYNSALNSYLFYPQGIDGIVTGVSYNRTGDYAAYGMRRTNGSQIRVFRTSDYQQTDSFTVANFGIFSLAFSPIENYLAAGTFQGNIYLIDINTDQVIRTFQQEDIITSVAFSPDGNFIAGGTDVSSTTIKIWNVQTGALLHTLTESDYGISDVAFSPNGEYLAAAIREYSSGSWFCRIKIWKVSDGTLVKHYIDNSGGVNGGGVSIAFSSSGENWFAYTYDNKIKFAETDLLFISPVPVELVSFTAAAFDKSVILKWETSTETNNKGFEIERKSTGESWSLIGFIPGSGTTSEKRTYKYTDENIRNSNYIYRLKQIDFDGSYSYSHEAEIKILFPDEFALQQNYPNPFNPSTKIRYSIPSDGFVTLRIYDILGNETALLVNENKTAGDYETIFNADDLPSGVYFSRLSFNGKENVVKLILNK